MNEISAAIGLDGLSKLKDRINENKKNHTAYKKLLKNIPGITFPEIRQSCKSNYSYCPILINKEFGLSRDILSKVFWKENIITRPYFSPGCHKHEPYKSEKNSYKNLKNTEKIAKRILCLPCFPDLGEKNIKTVANVITEAYEKREKIKSNLKSTTKK